MNNPDTPGSASGFDMRVADGRANAQLDPRTIAADDRGANRDEIDLLMYWRILVKRRRFVAFGLAIGVIVAVALTLLMTPIYRATATIQIERDVAQVVEVKGLTHVQGSEDTDFYQTQLELLKSRTLAERAVDQLHLGDPSVLAQYGLGSWSDHVGRSTAATGHGGVAPSPEQKRRAVELVQRALDVEPVRNSALIQVNFDSPSPEFSARGANAVADGFIAAGIDRRLGASSYAR